MVAATESKYCLSSKEGSSKAMENVSIGPAASVAQAATSDESIPPERNTPTGTSATSWRWTVSRKRLSQRATSSPGGYDDRGAVDSSANGRRDSAPSRE